MEMGNGHSTSLKDEYGALFKGWETTATTTSSSSYGINFTWENEKKKKKMAKNGCACYWKVIKIQPGL